MLEAIGMHCPQWLSGHLFVRHGAILVVITASVSTSHANLHLTVGPLLCLDLSLGYVGVFSLWGKTEILIVCVLFCMYVMLP